MKSRKDALHLAVRRGLPIFFSLLLLIAMTAPVLAGDADTLLKEADQTLRSAQRNMFGGKAEQAAEEWKKAAGLIEQAQAMEPDNPKLKIVSGKSTKLQKDLERRGLDLGAGTLTGRSSGTAPALPDKPVPKALEKAVPAPATGAAKAATEQEKVPYAARRPLQVATMQVHTLEANLSRIPNADRDDMKDSYIKRAGDNIEEAKKQLAEARKLAAEKGVTSHPDFDELEAAIADGEKRFKALSAARGEEKAKMAASAGQVQQDVDTMNARYDSLRDKVFNRAMGTLPYYANMEEAAALLEAMEAFERDDLPALQPELAAFSSKYGDTKDAIDKNADAAGFQRGSYGASYGYMGIKEGIENVRKTRSLLAEDLCKKADAMFTNRVSDFFRLENHKRIRKCMALAVECAPENPVVKTARAELDGRIDEDLKAFNAAVDKRAWAGNATNAPGDCTKLAAAALAFFKNSPDWGRRADNPDVKDDKDTRNPVKVAVTGPWSVQKTNLLGEPIMYGLPVHLAVAVDSEKSLDVLRVYNLTMRTNEGKGVAMAPPFSSVTVGDSWYVRPSAVK